MEGCPPKTILHAHLVRATWLLSALCSLICASGHAAGWALEKCNKPSECRSHVCLRTEHQSYCAGSCDTGGCPSGMYCDSAMFAWSGMQAACVKGNGPQMLSELPRVRCRVDNDCPSGGPCALDAGERVCTQLCHTDNDCRPAPIRDTFVKALQCGRVGRRSVCVTKPDCVRNPVSCMSRKDDAR